LSYARTATNKIPAWMVLLKWNLGGLAGVFRK